MKYALISDIHSNLPALETVLEDIDSQEGVDAIYHLGDLVGYAPWPNEVVALIRERGIPGIAGNYDSTTATDYPHCGCKADSPRGEELSHLSYEWTRAHVSPETKRFLGALPFRMDLRPRGGHKSRPTLTLVHGTPTLNTLYWTEDRPDSFCLQDGEGCGGRGGRPDRLRPHPQALAPARRRSEFPQHRLGRQAQGRRLEGGIRVSRDRRGDRSASSSCGSSTTWSGRSRASIAANSPTSSPISSRRVGRRSRSR